MSAEWLAVVPARGGSVSIPGKNRRMVGSQMLAERAIHRACLITGDPKRVIVTSDDDVILDLALYSGCVPLVRPPSLAGPEVGIADTVDHAVAAARAQGIYTDGPVVVCQPTSPLLTDETAVMVTEDFISNPEWDSLMTVAPNHHLAWWEHADGSTKPIYEARVNRQYRQDTIWQETGGIICARTWNGPTSLIGNCHYLYPIDSAEALDVDTPIDLATAQVADLVSTIEWRIIAGQQVGYGHMYRCLALAAELPHHVHRFIVDGPEEAVLLVDECYDALPYGEAFDSAPDVTVFDCLRVSFGDFDKAMDEESKTIGIELVSIPEGARFDVYVDELGGRVPNLIADSARHAFIGPVYASIRDEFRVARTAATNPDVLDRIRIPRRVLITFGGEDPNRLTMAALETLAAVENVVAVVGPGFSPQYAHLLRERWPSQIIESHNVRMAREMLKADVVITSGGRTVWEAASLGCSIICIPVNWRERDHAFPMTSRRIPAHDLDPGTLKLLTSLALDDDNTAQGRADRIQHASVDGRGAHRVAYIIDGLIQNYL